MDPDPTLRHGAIPDALSSFSAQSERHIVTAGTARGHCVEQEHGVQEFVQADTIVKDIDFQLRSSRTTFSAAAAAAPPRRRVFPSAAPLHSLQHANRFSVLGFIPSAAHTTLLSLALSLSLSPSSLSPLPQWEV